MQPGTWPRSNSRCGPSSTAIGAMGPFAILPSFTCSPPQAAKCSQQLLQQPEDAEDEQHIVLTPVKPSLATDSQKRSLFSHYYGRVTKPRIKLQPYQQPVYSEAIKHQTLRLGDINLALTLKQFKCPFGLSINMQHLRSTLPSSLEQACSRLPEDVLLKRSEICYAAE